jgi:hypothetical protein
MNSCQGLRDGVNRENIVGNKISTRAILLKNSSAYVNSISDSDNYISP